jgi:hypothetical protein
MRVPITVSTDESVPMPDRVTAAKRKLRQEFENAGSGLVRVADDLNKLLMASIRMKATAGRVV